jgi:hypothetical protein
MSIETYLGTTKHKNLYFTGTGIPPAWEFKSYHIDLEQAKNSIANQFGVDYTINNLGYNSTFDYDESLTNTPSILCLGDSNVFGLLLGKSQNFVQLLQDRMPDVKVLNLGLPGGSADSVTRIGVNTVMALKNQVKAVFVIWPTYLRREFASNCYHGLVYKTPDNSGSIPYPEYWDFIDWRANSYNFHKNRIMLSAVCESQNVLFADIEFNYDEEHIRNDTIESYGNQAYTTIGHKTHRAVADYFASKISTNSHATVAK